MSVLSTKIEGAFVIMPNGRLDSNNFSEVEKLVVEHIGRGERSVIFDFSKTDYISSAGLRVLLQAAKLLRKDGRLALCNANEQVYEVLEISGFLDMIEHCQTLEQAMSFVS